MLLVLIVFALFFSLIVFFIYFVKKKEGLFWYDITRGTFYMCIAVLTVVDYGAKIISDEGISSFETEMSALIILVSIVESLANLSAAIERREKEREKVKKNK